MKKKYITILFIVLNQIFYAQVVDVLTNVGVNDIAFYGNDLYYVNAQGVYKADVTLTNPVETQVLSLSNSYCLAFHNTDLYVIAGSNPQKLYKIDVTQATPIATEIAGSGISFAVDMKVKSDFLYIADYNASKISRVDLLSFVPSVVTYISSINRPQDLVFNNSELYIAIDQDDKISKVDVSQTTPSLVDVQTMGINNPQALAFNGDELFIADDFNAIQRINYTKAVPVLTSVATSLNNPNSLEFHNGDLYIAEINGNKISKIEAQTLSNPNLDLNVLGLYPNPVVKSFKTNTNETINHINVYDLQGKLVKIFSAKQDSYNIEDLNIGIYFVKIAFGNYTVTKKLIKH